MYAGPGAGFGEAGILRQKAIAWMNSVCPGGLGDLQYQLLVEVGLACGDARQQVALVGLAGPGSAAIHLRINGDGADAQLPASPENAPGNFTPIGNQNLLKHANNPSSYNESSQAVLRFSTKARMPSCPSWLTTREAKRSLV